MEKNQAFAIARRQLALEFGVRPEDFIRPGITFTTPARRPGARGTIREGPALLIACMGNSLVVAAEGELRELAEQLAREVNGLHRMVEFPALKRLDAALVRQGRSLWGTEHFFLPGGPLREIPLPGEFTYRWYDPESVKAFYPNRRFRMALGAEPNPDRPDVIALAAMEGERIAGVAGASADTDTMWQVGIDVEPDYWGRGLGTALVSALCREIEKKGKLPFYGTAVGNLASQAIAVACGLAPAWIETDA